MCAQQAKAAPLCLYMAEWLWPQAEDFLHVRLSMADLGLDEDVQEGEGQEKRRRRR